MCLVRISDELRDLRDIWSQWNISRFRTFHIELVHLLWRNGPTRAMASSFMKLLGHAQRRTPFGRTALDKWSACRRQLYLITYKKQTSMPPAGFDPTISACERPHTYTLDRAAIGTSELVHLERVIYSEVHTAFIFMWRGGPGNQFSQTSLSLCTMKADTFTLFQIMYVETVHRNSLFFRKILNP